jgi:DNA-binding CsgD family transcriptional regulator
MARRRSELTETIAGLGGRIDPSIGELRVAAAVADRDGIIRWQNDRLTELFGDCVGRSLASLVAPESAHRQRQEFMKKMIGSSRTSDYQLNALGPDGSHVPIDVSSVVVEGSDHQIVGVFGVAEPVAPAYKPPPIAGTGLTPRQLEVLHMLDRGLSTKQIARELGIQIDTVRNHIGALFRSLGVHTRLQAVVEARRRGLIKPD